ncbi:MAG TPA: hypothetical protein VGM80_00170 [Gaiellaceae bacterium]|jgi:hypothetical protein
MATWIWIVIAAAVVLVCVAAAMQMTSRRRTQRLQDRFGPEYDRTARVAGGRRDAEADLRARESRRDGLDIRPLPAATRDRYATKWQDVQAEFVDSPTDAVAHADSLVNAVMSDRGYPMDDFGQRASDVSVDHPQVVEHYRAAHQIFASMVDGSVSTEEERQAMKHYRMLFDDLLDANGTDGGSEPAGVSSRPIEEAHRV